MELKRYLRVIASTGDDEDDYSMVEISNRRAREAADYIEKLESVTKDDAKWLAAYHKWCEMNGCAPSSSDLISARKALEGENGVSNG